MKSKMIYIADDGTEFDNRLDCEKHERELERRKKEEDKAALDSFLASVGFDSSKFETELEYNNALNATWLIFDKYGNIKGLKTCGGGNLERNGVTFDFRYISGDDRNDSEILENWLRDNKLYGHNLSSFSRRVKAFYEMPFLDKLKNLGWEVKNEQLVNTGW